MATKIFLGEPPANIKQWIIDHATLPGPAGHAETRFTLQGGTVETYNITGTLDQQWMIDNGYFNADNGIWLKNITQANIGNTVTSIGNSTFSDCTTLTNVTIGDNVTSIGYYAFYFCQFLASITIPNDVTSIGYGAFDSCSNLASLTIPDSVMSIEDLAFYDCRSLTSVTIVATGKPGASAESVKQMIITAIDDTSISDNITWNMPN